MSEPPKLLPLGTAVRVTDHEGVYVIIARGFQKQANGYLAGYKGMPHPHGSGAGVREIVITQTQICEVVHPGYEDAADASFTQKQLEHAIAPTAARPPAPDPALVRDQSKPAEHLPPATKPAGGPPARGAIDPNDPFKELRSRGRQR
jgi:hypothetical protein